MTGSDSGRPEYDVQWTETMRGALVRGADDYDPTTGGIPERLRFTVRGTIPKFDAFLTDDDHVVDLDGTVDCAVVGDGPRRVDRGELHLLRPTSSPAVLEMMYSLPFAGEDGRRFQLIGVKTLRDDRGLDLWPDTSTLDVVLRAAPAGNPAATPSEALARGRLRISFPGFLRLFLLMRAAGGGFFGRHPWSHLKLRLRFAAWFLGRLLHIYGNPFRAGSSSTQIAGDRVGRTIRAKRSELHFMPRGRVQWTTPRTLWRTFQQLRQSTSLSGQVDVRRYQPIGIRRYDELRDDDEAWVDFVADTGDGFAATYSVAYAVSQPHLDAGGRCTERGRILVLGGDLVYPTPTREEYEHRTCGPWMAALPEDPDSEHVVLAIPGNHDWYDSLNAFQHYFMGVGQHVGGRHVVQQQSYVAAELPHGWWLLAIDIALDQRIDDRQIAFLNDVVADMPPDARVILVIAKPEWLTEPESRGARNLHFVESLLPERALRLVLTGDMHHFARYGGGKKPTAMPDTSTPVRITCGGGGAYTAGTHHLPRQLSSDWGSVGDGEGPSLVKTYPNRRASLRMRRGVLTAFIRRWSFMMAAGLIVLVLDLLVLSSDVSPTTSTIDALRGASYGGAWGATGRGVIHSPLAAVATSLVAAGLIGFALLGRRRAGTVRALAAGCLHAAAQLAAIETVLWLLMRPDAHGLPDALLLAGGAFGGGAVTVSVLFGVYLYVTDRWFLHPDAVFAVQARTEYKSFLRLNVRPDGWLDVFVYGIPQIVKTWERNPRAGGAAPLLVPTEPLGGSEPERYGFERGKPPIVELIEQVRIDPKRA